MPDKEAERVDALLDELSEQAQRASVAEASSRGYRAVAAERRRLDGAAMLDGARQAIQLALDEYDGTPWPEYLARVRDNFASQLAALAAEDKTRRPQP